MEEGGGSQYHVSNPLRPIQSYSHRDCSANCTLLPNKEAHPPTVRTPTCHHFTRHSPPCLFFELALALVIMLKYCNHPNSRHSRNTMIEAFKKSQLNRNWFTITSLVSKDFKLKYRRSVLGVLWSVLNPLLMMCVLAAVFTNVLKFGDVANFPMYLILGNVLFALMSDSTTGAMTSILESAPLIKKIRIEKLIFPIEKVLFQLVNFAISLIAVVLVMAFFRIAPTVNLLALPLLLVYMLLFCSGLGMLLSALAVFFRDVCHLWGVVITAWTYATPLFYPVSLLPDWMQQAEFFNPMYHYVTYFRDIAMYNCMPSLEENLVCLGMAIITFIIGLLVFKKSEKKFILYV